MNGRKDWKGRDHMHIECLFLFFSHKDIRINILFRFINALDSFDRVN